MRRLLLALLLVLASAGLASADPYFNSSESGCDGTDPNVYFCDDFEDGSWFVTDGDSGGFADVGNDGWGASLGHDGPINGATVCGPGVTPFGNCVASGGTRNCTPGPDSCGSKNQAFHRFKTPTCGSTSAEQCPAINNEIYIRWYAKWVAGYQWGNDKNMNISNYDGDIAFADLTLGGSRCGSGAPSSTSDIGIAVNHGTIPDGGACGPQNQGNNITLQSGRWYFFEFHVKAGTNGLLELWVNDCGVTGTSCGAAPILRTRYGTGNPGSPVSLPGNCALTGNRPGCDKIEMAWLENWSGIAAIGTGPYWDQIKASAVGPIGFAGAGPGVQIPLAPINLRIQAH